MVVQYMYICIKIVKPITEEEYFERHYDNLIAIRLEISYYFFLVFLRNFAHDF